jgi:hypothetical protein
MLCQDTGTSFFMASAKSGCSGNNPTIAKEENAIMIENLKKFKILLCASRPTARSIPRKNCGRHAQPRIATRGNPTCPIRLPGPAYMRIEIGGVFTRPSRKPMSPLSKAATYAATIEIKATIKMPSGKKAKALPLQDPVVVLSAISFALRCEGTGTIACLVCFFKACGLWMSIITYSTYGTLLYRYVL